MPLSLPAKESSRAVFIGTARYAAGGGLPQLPTVETSARRLWHLLCEREEAVFDEAHCPPLLIDPERGSDIVKALKSAVDGAHGTLFVYYAGHAVSRWVDDTERLYLVPSGAEGERIEADSLDFALVREALRESSARIRVLVLDCCYSGIAATGTLSGPVGESGPPQPVTDPGLGDGWWIITSSASHRPASDSDGRGFTAFTGKLIEGLEEGVDPVRQGAEPDHLGLDALFEYARRALDGQSPQRIGSGGADVALGPNPRRLPAISKEWSDSVVRVLEACGLPHQEQTAAAALVRSVVERLARHQQRVTTQVADDPWRCPEVALRMSDELAKMLSRAAGQPSPVLSQAEAVLVALLPFVHTTWWDAALAESRRSADPVQSLLAEVPWPHEPLPQEPCAETPASVSYQDFLKRHPALQRRAVSALQRQRAEAAESICWWLYRQWVVKRATVEQTLDPLGPVLRASDSPGGPEDTGTRTLRELFGGPAPFSDLIDQLLKPLLSAPDPRLHLKTRHHNEGSREVRAGLLAKMLTVAHQTAIDPFTLRTAVDHLSGGSLFTPKAVGDCDCSWSPFRGDHDKTLLVYDLNATCDLPESASVLRAHCAELDHYVLQCTVDRTEKAETAVLRQLIPPRFSSLGVLPRETHGQQRFSLTEMRFTLDPDRIRELLMGSRIYPGPELALRELFQNALDACRHRDKRVEFLAWRSGRNRGGAKTAVPAGRGAWRGSITFTTGIEDGRPYVECYDNGVGMGEEELEGLFSRGGTRFTLSREYLEEQADWRRAGISLHANSAFGIGVFSYFMIADEIRVTTRRYSRSGELGRTLQVEIAGPGALFHITEADPLYEGGTAVRLFLKPGLGLPPVTDVLRQWVWLSDYDLEATAGDDGPPAGDPNAREDVFRLEAGQLSLRAFADGLIPRPTVEGLTSEVWWCTGQGGILRDGLWINTPIFGAVVNLTGAVAPELTVDRSGPRDPKAIDVDPVLVRHLDRLITAGRSVLNPRWVANLAQERLRFADLVTERAVAARVEQWELCGVPADISVVGCFTPEIQRLDEADSADPEAYEAATTWGARRPNGRPGDKMWDEHLLIRAVSALGGFTAPVADWRARAWVRAGLVPGVALDPGERLPVARPSDSRLLGIEEPGESGESSPNPFLDRLPAGTGLRRRTRGGVPDRGPRALRAGPRPSLAEVLSAVDRTGLSYLEAVERLAELGHDMSGVPERFPADEHDRVLVSHRLDGEAPWLDADTGLSQEHVLGAAAATGLLVEAVLERFTALGYETPSVPAHLLGRTLEPADVILVSRDLDGQPPWLEPGAEVPVPHVPAAASATNRPVAEVLERLTTLGFPVPDPSHPMLRELRDELPVVSADLEGRPPWLDPRETVSVHHVLRAMLKTGLSAPEVLGQLTLMGFKVPDASHPWLRMPLAASDMILLSRDLNGKAPWLDIGTEVAPQHILCGALWTNTTMGEVVERLTMLGFTVPDPSHPMLRVTPSAADPNDRLLVSRGTDGSYPWLDLDEEVPALHIVESAGITGTQVGRLRERLRELGYRVPAASHPLLDPSRTQDLILVSVDLDGESPWLNARRTVSVQHVLRATLKTGLTAPEVLERFTTLGFSVPDPFHPLLGLTSRHEDLIMISHDLDGGGPWLHDTEEVAAGQVLGAAVRTGLTPRKVLERLSELGFTTAEFPPHMLDTAAPGEDLMLLSRDLDGKPPWLDITAEVPLLHILEAATRTKQKPWQIAHRLGHLGLRLPRGVSFHREER